MSDVDPVTEQASRAVAREAGRQAIRDAAARATASLRYRRGTGHVLAPGHDLATCTACAYDAGFRAGRREGGVAP